MTLPWLKEIPYQMNLFGPVCPFCCEIKTHLVTKLFQEGIGWICEDCRKYETTCEERKIYYEGKLRPVSDVEEIIADQLEVENPNLDLDVNISEESND